MFGRVAGVACATAWFPSRVPGQPDLEFDAARTTFVLHPLRLTLKRICESASVVGSCQD